MSTLEHLVDELLASDGPAALICRQWLMPAEGRDAVIFPPTFAAAEGSGSKAGYNIDPLEPRNDQSPLTAILDTVGSQANRMEPLFKRANGEDTRYSKLVPQIDIKAGNKTVDLLDAGHRAADAVVRYSALGPKLREAFDSYAETGDATELARIAPTSLVFGAWDSRDTQAKLSRLVASTIRAYDVVPLRRSAQYFPPLDYVKEGLFEDKLLETKIKGTNVGSHFGLKAAPAAGTHGGVIVRGEIRREAILSLVALRALGPKGANGDALRRYILGLALIAMTYDRPHELRQGCLLVADPDKSAVWELVSHGGVRKQFTPDGDATMIFAQEAAKRFGVGASRTVDFDSQAANRAIREKLDEKGKRK